MIEDRRDVVRRVAGSTRHPAPVVAAEHPWETRRTFYPTVLQDEENGRLRMWYGTLPAVPPGGPVPPYSLLYAESDDGFRWEKPLLDLVPFGDHARTNILYRGEHGNCSAFCVVIDPNEPDPSCRFKMIHKGGRRPDGSLAEDLALSPDGIVWRPYDQNPIMPERHDTNLNLLYDTTRRLWTAYLRPYAFASGLWPGAGRGHHRRRIAVTQSADLIHWSKIRTVIGPEEGDANEFDNIAVFPYGDFLIGLIGTFEEDPSNPHGQQMRIELAMSDDGERWERMPPNQPFLQPTGVDGDFDRDSVYASTAALIDDEAHEFLIYYNGASWGDGDPGDGSSAIGILRVPTDRFVEQYADASGGWLLTREFLLEGDAVQVNVRARGSVTVEIAEYPGHAVPGYSLAECDPVTGDHLARTVTWRGGDADLSRLRGKPVYLRFHLMDAVIYSFKVSGSSRST